MENVIEKAPLGEVHNEIIPIENPIVKNEADIDGFIDLRQKFIAKVNAICVEGKDYHVIEGKKSIAKGGAEKIASIFKWTAKFEKDTEALEMLGDIKGLVAFKCTLVNGQFVGEGRGSASLSKNGNDPNKTLKMAQKSAFIDAVLRASGLSDFFTQDLEDMPQEQIAQRDQYTSNPYGAYSPKPETKNYTQTSTRPSDKQIQLIGDLCKQKGYNKEDILNWGFTKLTGGKDGTASELMQALFNAKTKVNANGVELPTIQQEVSEEEQAVIDSIPF